MIEVTPLFSIPVYHSRMEFLQQEVAYCRSLPKKHNNISNLDITVTSRLLDDPNLNDLKTKSKQHIDTYVTDVVSINQDNINFKINTSWYLEMTNNSNVTSHKHNHSIFTVVIIVDCTKNSRLILSVDHPPLVPGFFEFEYDTFNVFNSQSWFFDLNPGDVFIFPSTIGHHAECIGDDGSISVVAMDTFVSGRLGGNITEITFAP